MARLIDADALLDEFLNRYTEREMEGNLVFAACEIKQDFADMISDATTVDAVEVVHGRWIDKGEYAVCTECGGRSGTQYDGVEPIPLMTQFCPNCGAKMDEVSE